MEVSHGFGLMDFVVIGTFLATLIVVVITAFSHFKQKDGEHHISDGENAIADSLREIIKIQSNDFLRVSQEYKDATTRMGNDIRDHIYANTIALNRLVDSIDQLTRNMLNDNNNLRNEIADINRRIRSNNL